MGGGEGGGRGGAAAVRELVGPLQVRSWGATAAVAAGDGELRRVSMRNCALVVKTRLFYSCNIAIYFERKAYAL